MKPHDQNGLPYSYRAAVTSKNIRRYYRDTLIGYWYSTLSRDTVGSVHVPHLVLCGQVFMLNLVSWKLQLPKCTYVLDAVDGLEHLVILVKILRVQTPKTP